ncbi:hypothetical protein N2152v2_009546 [Parachlorella kessleri]
MQHLITVDDPLTLMGNSSSTSAIWIQCDSPTGYYAGDVVRGVVCLSCAQNVTTTGIELKVPLGPSGSLAAGQYQFGFVFALPHNLPGSFSYSRGDCRADVIYKVKACCHTPGMFSPSIKASQQLLVYQRLQTVPSSVMQQAEAEVYFCCCFRRGHASALIDVDRDHYVAGQQAQIRLQADNQSSDGFKAVEVRLVRRVVLQADFAWKRTEKDTVCKHTYPGVPSYTTLRGGLARLIPLALPPSLPPTTHGQLIQCDYFVEVVLKGGRCVSDLKMMTPVIIHPPQPQDAVFFAQPPPEWQPSKIYDPVAIEVPSAPPLPPDALSPQSPFWQKAMTFKGHSSGSQQQEKQADTLI